MVDALRLGKFVPGLSSGEHPETYPLAGTGEQSLGDRLEAFKTKAFLASLLNEQVVYVGPVIEAPKITK